VKKNESTEAAEHKVILSPAMTSPIEGHRIFFLFSLYQVEDIQGTLKVRRVPFSVPYVEGITLWRGHAIPVISLECYMGLSPTKVNGGSRFLIIRSTIESEETGKELRAAIQIGREIRMIPVPLTGEPVESDRWISSDLVKGIYQWENGLIVVPEMEQIFRIDTGCPL